MKTNTPISQPSGEAPRACDWCGIVPEVVRGAGYDYRVECQTATCMVQPSTVGIRGRQNAIEAWNTRVPSPDSIDLDPLEFWCDLAEVLGHPRPTKVNPATLVAEVNERLSPDSIREKAQRAAERIANLISTDDADILKRVAEIITAEFQK